MRLLLLSLLVLLAAAGLALAARQDPGYVLITLHGWSVETSFTFFAVVLLTAFVLFDVLLRSLLRTWTFPQRLSRWHQKRRSLRARRATQRGLLALAEGHWSSAEKSLSRYADESELPLLNYLAAARAAQKQGADNRRDHYLSEAHHSMPDAELAVGLTQADVQLSHGQLEQALATLMHLRSIAPRHQYVLYLLKRLYEKLAAWDDLQALLPELKKQKVLDSKQLKQLEITVHQQRIEQSGKARDNKRLTAYWDEIPRALHREPVLVGCYARHLLALGEMQRAEQVLREALQQHFDVTLVRLYGQVTGSEPAQQLSQAESWLTAHAQNAELLLALGRLALKNELWGKARSYLEASLGIESRAETCCELGNLLKQLGEEESAAEYYRRGLEATVGDACTRFKVQADRSVKKISG